MVPTRDNTRRWVAVMLAVSLLALVLTVVCVRVEAGYGLLRGTGAKDSLGNPIGFGDPVTFEHFGMMFREASIPAIWGSADSYQKALVAVQLISIGVLLGFLVKGAIEKRVLISVCALQAVVAAPGFLTITFLSVAGRPKIDGETIVDFGFAYGAVPAALATACSLALTAAHLFLNSDRALKSSVAIA